MVQTMLDLEALLDREGWDRPATLYAIEGTPESPEFRLILTVNGHPFNVMADLIEHGTVLKHQGLALCHEGWRHLRFDEAMKLSPEVKERMEQMTRMLSSIAPEAEVQEHLAKAWQRITAEKMEPPSKQPDDKRVEIRNVSVVLPDGTSYGIMRDRGKEPEPNSRWLTKEEVLRARVPAAMYALLTGDASVIHGMERAKA